MSNNYKKILCYNILNCNVCTYRDKCLFAHSLDEQVKENIKQKIINIILYDENLSNLNICYDNLFYNEIMVFTNECKNSISKYKRINKYT